MSHTQKKDAFSNKGWYTSNNGGRMKSYALKIENTGLPTTTFIGQVVMTGIGNVESFKSNDVNAVKTFLSSRGVYLEDINAALQIMEDEGHNKAEFGTFGSFTYSTFEGNAQ